MSIKNEFCQIFEIELKRKLSERSKSTTDELRLLLNSFKFYDLDYIGIIDKNQWVRGILKTGLTGFSENDLLSIFPYYDQNNSGFIDYKNFSNYLYGREQFNPLPKTPNINVFEPYNNISIKSVSYNNNDNTINNNNFNRYNYNNYILNPNLYSQNQNNQNINLRNDNQISYNKNSEKITKKKEMKKFFDELILKFRNRINVNNGLTFYIFAQKLKAYEINNKINLNDLIQIFKEMRLDFTETDIKNFFYMLDFNETNFINIDDIISKIKGELSEERKLYLLNKFSLIDKSQKGEISINYMKIIYKNNAKFHPDVVNGIKSEDVVYNQFRQTLELYLDINKILNEMLTKEQFVDYYWGISASIPDDIYFQDILNGIWNLSKLYNVNNNNTNIKEKNFYDESNNNEIKNYFEKYNNINRQNNYNNMRNNNKLMSKSLSTPQLVSEKYIHTPYSNIRNNILNKNNNENISNKAQNTNENIRYNQNYNPISNIEENKNLKSISDPYYRPRITPGNKGIKMFKKIIYNPITKELLYYDNFNEKYNRENNNNPNDNRIKSPVKQYKNNIYLFDEDKYNHQKLMDLFNKFKKEIISKGEKSIFTLQKILYEFNTDYHPNLISFDNFCMLFQKLDIKNINVDGIQKIFKIFDINNTGYINYDTFFKNIVGYMGRNRQELVRKIYEILKKDENGNIFVYDLKRLFNANKYNEIFGGLKAKEYVYYEFIDNLEIFLNYRNKLYNKNLSNILDYNDFLRFFDQISMYIDNDNIFEDYIYSCWNINNKYNYMDSKIKYNNRNNMIRTGSQIMNW